MYNRTSKCDHFSRHQNFPRKLYNWNSGKRSSVLEFFIVFDLFQATFRYNGQMSDLCVNSMYFATQSMKRSLRNNIDICMQIVASLQFDLPQFDSRRWQLTLRILGGRLREVWLYYSVSSHIKKTWTKFKTRPLASYFWRTLIWLISRWNIVMSACLVKRQNSFPQEIQDARMRRFYLIFKHV